MVGTILPPAEFGGAPVARMRMTASPSTDHPDRHVRIVKAVAARLADFGVEVIETVPGDDPVARRRASECGFAPHDLARPGSCAWTRREDRSPAPRLG